MMASVSSVGGVFDVTNSSGTGAFVLVCEHASNAIPPQFDNLGLTPDVLQTHVAWDPGAHAVAAAMSAKLDCPLIAPRVSRLVYDCNRARDAQSAVPDRSESYEIPGNKGLSDADRQARADQYYTPFRDALATLIDQRTAEIQAPVIITVHSFAPVYDGEKRDLELGIIHDSDARFADSFLAAAQADATFGVRRNEPYAPKDGVTHTLTEHALPRGLLNVMIEIRNDLITMPTGQHAVAEYLCTCAAKAVAEASNDPNVANGSCPATEPAPICSPVRHKDNTPSGPVVVGTR